GLPPLGQKKADEDAAAAIVEEPKVQRVQPQRKNRKKK
ncbi:MAG: membrane protein insertase YidC, partial [Micrococcaceae bacterium]|nr:membrane protein insertase YidC [Micrococcaceae bacterium]